MAITVNDSIALSTGQSVSNSYATVKGAVEIIRNSEGVLKLRALVWYYLNEQAYTDNLSILKAVVKEYTVANVDSDPRALFYTALKAEYISCSDV